MAVLPLLLPLCAALGGLAEGPWHARLESPGGPLPFGLEIEATEHGWAATIVNGRERLAVPEVTRERTGEVVFAFPHLDSRIVAEVDGDAMAGHWEKRRGPDTWAWMEFRATRGTAPRFEPETLVWHEDPPPIAGRWAIDLETDHIPAVGLFEDAGDGAVTGTILTSAGDYRYLAGVYAGGRLRLSGFDGAHAFLFDALAGDDGVLAGDFWSGDHWHETFAARRDPEVEPPDPFALSYWTAAKPLNEVRFRDLDGELRALDDPEFAGRARVLQLFGTWCPNCHEAADVLVDLQERYGDRGLSVLGLAFEHTGDFRRDAEQVRRYAEEHGVDFPILLAGISDKERATIDFPLLDRVRAFPTTVFMDAGGAVRAVHTGFAGEATGAYHAELRAEFERLVQELLRG